MRKRLIYAACTGIALLCFSTPVQALSVEWSENPVITDSVNGITLATRLSPRVEIKYVGATRFYAIGARNTQGDKTYAVNTGYTGVFWKEGMDHDFSQASEAFTGWRRVSD